MTDFAEEKLWWSAMQQMSGLEGRALAELANRWFPAEGMPIVDDYGRPARWLPRWGTYVPLSMEDRRVIETQLGDPLGDDEDIGDMNGLNAPDDDDDDTDLTEAELDRLRRETDD